MRLFFKAKDGGAESTVTGYWLIEWKRGFSVVLLRFDNGSRDAYHSHAFNTVSWVLRGMLKEHVIDSQWEGVPCGPVGATFYRASFRPVVTRRSRFHKVISYGTTWVLSFRGPWSKTWWEYRPAENRFVTLSDGRVES